MKVLIAVLFLTQLVLFSGCRKEAVQVDISKVCSPDNEKKYVFTTGQLDAQKSIFCSNTGGRMDCGLDVVTSPGSPRVFGADIEQGSGANQIEKLSSGYKREDIKVHDNTGNVISLTDDKVKLTGQMSIAPDGKSVCFMKVDKIEKQ